MLGIGIDPGKLGAITVLNSENPSWPDFIEMPLLPVGVNKSGSFRTRIDFRQLRKIMDNYIVSGEEIHFVMEKLHDFTHAVINCAPKGQWNFAADYGALENMLQEFGDRYGIKHDLYLPQEWQKAVRKSGGKEGSVTRALELFPQCHQQLKRGKYYHDGKAESLLLAYLAITETRTLRKPTQQTRRRVNDGAHAQ